MGRETVLCRRGREADQITVRLADDEGLCTPWLAPDRLVEWCTRCLKFAVERLRGRQRGYYQRIVPGAWHALAPNERVCSFLKKRTKKLLDIGVRGPARVHTNEQKSFASFLQKRRPYYPAAA